MQISKFMEMAELHYCLVLFGHKPGETTAEKLVNSSNMP